MSCLAHLPGDFVRQVAKAVPVFSRRIMLDQDRCEWQAAMAPTKSQDKLRDWSETGDSHFFLPQHLGRFEKGKRKE